MPASDDPTVGLCASCKHCRIVQAARSTFHLCTRSFTDERFRKYPPLPVLRCIGYEKLMFSSDSGPDEPKDR
jgi:hypothetical protein